MNIYKVQKTLSLFAGLLLLTNKLSDPRQHALSAQPVRAKALNLTADDLKNMGAENADDLCVYEIIAPVQFKVGQVIGLAGDVNKATLALIAPAGEQPTPETTVVTSAADPVIIAAIAKLERGNTSHWTTQGKPELAALSALVSRKITGKERDAAFAQYQLGRELLLITSLRDAVFPAHQADVTLAEAPAVIADDLRAALANLDPADDDNYDADGVTPKLELIASFCAREVSAAELDTALSVLDAEQEPGAEHPGTE